MPEENQALPENPTLEQELEAQQAENPTDDGRSDFQEEMILGKFKSQEDLVKAYQELEKKFSSGERSNEPIEETPEEPAPEETQGDLGDLEQFYGQGLAKFAQESGLDLKAINQEFAEKGELSEQSYEALSKAGFGTEFMNTYLAGIKYQQEQGQREVLSKAYEALGGQQELEATITWASENLSDADKQAYNELVDSGKTDAALAILKGYKAQMMMSQGFEGKLVTGGTSSNANDVFESQAQVLQAMSDPRYDSDPAYRRKVIAKIERSPDI